MNWRAWVDETLKANEELVALAKGGIHSTLSETPKAKPFIVVRMSTKTPDVGDFQDIAIWVHDQPGTYKTIDEILGKIRDLLDGPITAPGAIAAIWQGDSNDLADDSRGTVVRVSNYRLAGRSA